MGKKIKTSHKRHPFYIRQERTKNPIMDKNSQSHIKDIEKNLDKVIIFKNDDDFLYLYKKTEKIATAVYLITNFFSVHEPLKWALREGVLSLLKDMLTLSNLSQAESEKSIREINSTIFRTISFFEVGLKAGFISEMNFTILKEEFYGIVFVLQAREKSHDKIDKVEGVTFDKSFFHVNQVDKAENLRAEPKDIQRNMLQKQDEKHVLYKGHAKGHSVLNQIEALHKEYTSNQIKIATPQNHPSSEQSSMSSTQNPSAGVTVDKSLERQKMIVNYLKLNNVITIKDLTRVIQGCSEKTIQRDLSSLITQGVVKKVGERRWSKYYLV